MYVSTTVCLVGFQILIQRPMIPRGPGRDRVLKGLQVHSCWKGKEDIYEADILQRETFVQGSFGGEPKVGTRG